jgi:multicomponent Na+:H+ antiporter subunit D
VAKIFVTNLDMYLPSLPLAVPLLMAAFLVGTSKLMPPRLRDFLAILTATFVAVVCVILMLLSRHQPIVYWFGGWLPHDGVALGISFFIDPISAGLAALVSLLVIAAFVYSLRYFDTVGTLYHALMLIFLGGMCGFSLSGDLFNMFVFLELMSAASVALCGYESQDPGSLQGALNFGIINTIAALLVLNGIGMLYARTGALNLAQIGATLGGGVDGLVITAFTFILTGFLIKAGAVPFHFWLADAYAVAPTPVCILFASVIDALALYAVARIYWTVFEGSLGAHTEALRGILVGAGILTALLGGVMCFAQHDIKRLLAFSTISHVGILLTGIGLLTPKALAGAAMYVAGHAMTKASLFLGAGILLHRFGSVDELQLRGRGRRLLITAVVFVLGGMGLAGMPPFGTFLGNTMMDEAAKQHGYSWLAAIVFAAEVLTGGAVLRFAGRVFGGWGAGEEARTAEDVTPQQNPETEGGRDRTPVTMIIPTVALCLLGIVLGVVPGFRHEAELAAIGLHDTAAYLAQVLNGLVSARPSPEQLSSLLPTVVRGTASTVCAVLIALIALSQPRLWIMRFPGVRSVQAGIRTLRQLHSGHVGDYVTWLVLGVGAFGALFRSRLF